MKNDRTSRILSRLETGLRMDSARLKQLACDFGVTLRSARDLGLEQDFSKEWDTTWNQRWVMVEDLLQRISGMMSEMDVAIDSSDRSRLKEAMGAWESIQSNDVNLVEIMSEIRGQASALNAAARIEWNLLATAFDADLETIHACSQALRVKLELLSEHTKEEVDLLVQGFLVNLPKLRQVDDLEMVKYQLKLDAAAVELGKERHQAGGFLDVVKALFMWVETPEERVKNDRSLRID
jgi:hypothetical protein